MPDHTPKPSVTTRSDPRRPASESSTLLAATYDVWPAGASTVLVDDMSTSRPAPRRCEFVGQHEGGPGLGVGDEAEVVRRRHVDQAVAQPAGGMDRSIESTERSLGSIEGAAELDGVAEVCMQDQYLDAELLEADDPTDPAAGRMVVRMSPEENLTVDSFGHRFGAHDRQVRGVRGREVGGEHLADAAETARDQVVAVMAEAHLIGAGEASAVEDTAGARRVAPRTRRCPTRPSSRRPRSRRPMQRRGRDRQVR